MLRARINHPPSMYMAHHVGSVSFLPVPESARGDRLPVQPVMSMRQPVQLVTSSSSLLGSSLSGHLNDDELGNGFGLWSCAHRSCPAIRLPFLSCLHCVWSGFWVVSF